MFGNFGLHVMKCPTGVFTYVGTIPYDLMTWRRATTADVMGGRSSKMGDVIVSYVTPVFASRDEAVEHAEAHGYLVRGEA